MESKNKQLIKDIKKKLNVKESLSMTERCLICRKDQEVGEEYTIYEDEGFALCPKCESNSEIKKAFENGRLWGALQILNSMETQSLVESNK